MDEYEIIKKTSLKFKGDKKKKKKKDRRVHDEESPRAQSDQNDRADDAEDHGGWWIVENFDEIRDDVAIEFLPGCYAKARSNGSIVLGDIHPPGDPPEEEEIFTVIRATTNQISLKSGFGRYLGLDVRKRIMGLSEAVGERELFLPVFEDNQVALCASNECFIAYDETEQPHPIIARAEKVEDREIIRIRVAGDPRLRRAQ